MSKKKEKKPGFWAGTKQYIKANPSMFCIYLILRLSVIVVMIAQARNGDYANVFMCFLTLFLFTIPTFVERRIKIDIPNTLEVIILLFIFAAEILGEIHEYYVNYSAWDTMLHTVNGFLCAAIGFALIDILNRHKKFSITMSPLFVALVAFCFSMTVGVVWEFYEYGSDTLLRTDMQKDRIVSTISSVSLHPDGRNIPIVLNGITETVIYHIEDGVLTETTVAGFLDTGIIDTMGDLIVNFIGATVFSVIGFFYIKHRGQGRNGRFVRRFLVTKMGNPDDDNNYWEFDLLD